MIMGVCPVCHEETRFFEHFSFMREHLLFCDNCGSYMSERTFYEWEQTFQARRMRGLASMNRGAK